MSTGTTKGGYAYIQLTTEDGLMLETEDGKILTTEELATTSLTIYDPGQDFKSCGVSVGVAIRNVTDGSSGLVTAVTEDTVTCTLSGGTNNAFTYGDTYAIYCTATYNSIISTTHTDKRYGRKATDKNQLIGRLFPKDIDFDEYGEKVFSPGQPRKEHM